MARSRQVAELSSARATAPTASTLRHEPARTREMGGIYTPKGARQIVEQRKESSATRSTLAMADGGTELMWTMATASVRDLEEGETGRGSP